MEGKKTPIYEKKTTISLSFALKPNTKACFLPPLELHRFSGNLTEWPAFLESFCNNIHWKVTFDGDISMAWLLSVLEWETKRSVESIGTSEIFYTTALKT